MNGLLHGGLMSQGAYQDMGEGLLSGRYSQPQGRGLLSALRGIGDPLYSMLGVPPPPRWEDDPAAQEMAQGIRSADLDTVGGMIGPGPMLGAIRGAGKAALPVRPAKEDIFDTLAAQFTHGRVVGSKTMPISKLRGGTSSAENPRVDDLVASMKGEDGFIERLIVDSKGNVIEGQHRLDALRKLGIKDVPVHVIEDLAEGVDLAAVRSDLSKIKGLHKEQRDRIIQNALEMAKESGSGAKALQEWELPRGFEAAYRAALKAIDK